MPRATQPYRQHVEKVVSCGFGDMRADRHTDTLITVLRFPTTVWPCRVIGPLRVCVCVLSVCPDNNFEQNDFSPRHFAHLMVYLVHIHGPGFENNIIQYVYSALKSCIS